MANAWVILTPAKSEIEGGYYADETCFVNLDNATSLWRMTDGTTEVWFSAVGEDARCIYVLETPAQIVAKLER